MNSTFSEMISYLKPLLSESDYNRLNHGLILRETNWKSQIDILCHRIATLEGLNLAISKELKDSKNVEAESPPSSSDLEQKVTELNSELGILRVEQESYKTLLGELVLTNNNLEHKVTELNTELGNLRRKLNAKLLSASIGAHCLPSYRPDEELYREEKESELLDKEGESPDDMYNMYNDYAFIHGFGIVKSNIHRSSKDNRLTSLKYSCCKEGKKNEGKEVEHERTQDKEARKKRHLKNDYKTECKAHIFIKPNESGKWVVTRHEMNHNHVFLNLEETTLLRSHRYIPKASVEEIYRMVKSGIKLVDAYNYIKMPKGSSDIIGFTEKKMHTMQ